MGSHFVTLDLDMGASAASVPSVCIGATDSVCVKTLATCGLTMSRSHSVCSACGGNCQTLVEAPSLTDYTPVVSRPVVDYHAPSVNSYVAAVDAPDGVAN
jgi:hypothetical protein